MNVETPEVATNAFAVRIPTTPAPVFFVDILLTPLKNRSTWLSFTASIKVFDPEVLNNLNWFDISLKSGDWMCNILPLLLSIWLLEPLW